MVKEVRIKLTAEQRAKIKAGTGKVINEIRVGSLGKSLAVTSAKATSARMARDASGLSARASRETLSPRGGQSEVSARASRETLSPRGGQSEVSARASRETLSPRGGPQSITARQARDANISSRVTRGTENQE